MVYEKNKENIYSEQGEVSVWNESQSQVVRIGRLNDQANIYSTIPFMDLVAWKFVVDRLFLEIHSRLTTEERGKCNTLLDDSDVILSEYHEAQKIDPKSNSCFGKFFALLRKYNVTVKDLCSKYYGPASKEDDEGL